MTVRLNGSTSGYTELDAPAVAGNNTLRFPNGNGSDGQILGTDGAGNLSWVNGRMVLATAQNTTSGTAIDFTGIPSWVKKITVMFNGVSLSGASSILVQIGSGSFTTSGYLSGSYGTNNSGITTTTGYALVVAGSNGTVAGTMQLNSIGGNTWVSNHQVYLVNALVSVVGGGSGGLSGTLDRLRLTTVNGTDTFDAGSVNILYEG
jgi:hypothetical protein